MVDPFRAGFRMSWESIEEWLCSARWNSSRHPHVAFFEAMFAVELALKHFLKIEGVFIEKFPSKGGDWHHNMKKLARKAATQISDPEDQGTLMDLVKRVEHVDIHDDDGSPAWTCEKAESGHIKYFDGISESDAEEKLVEAEDAIAFLKGLSEGT